MPTLAPASRRLTDDTYAAGSILQASANFHDAIRRHIRYFATGDARLGASRCRAMTVRLRTTTLL